MRDDFCAFILTHGRPDKVHTYRELRRSGYTGRVYLVVDDEDKSAQQYIDRYGDQVLTFSKEAVQAATDDGDNFNDRRTPLHARNACWELARQVGVKYFIQLDDDYIRFQYRIGASYQYTTININRTMDSLLDAMVAFHGSTPALTLAMSQGGDWIGGGGERLIPCRMRRKAMNSFICSVDRPFQFIGRMNDDVNTYVRLGHTGSLFLTVLAPMLVQEQTQASSGGLTDAYLDYGTYVKSFYTVMYAPSCTTVGVMGDTRKRIHHKINWNNAVPVILREEHRRRSGESR